MKTPNINIKRGKNQKLRRDRMKNKRVQKREAGTEVKPIK